MNATHPRLVEDYMHRLEHSLRDLPRSHRMEIESEIEDHINEALAGMGPQPSGADVRNVLERLGDPEDIAAEAAEAAERFGITRAQPRAADTAAIILLLVGGILLPVIGWLIGVALLWTSKIFTTRDKWIGTLIPPGGLALAASQLLLTAGPGNCVTRTSRRGVEVTMCSASALEGGAGVAFLVLSVIASLATAVYLGRRLGHARGRHA